MTRLSFIATCLALVGLPAASSAPASAADSLMVVAQAAPLGAPPSAPFSSPGLGAAPPSSPRPRPPIKGRLYNLKVDSSPQQAAVYWDVGTAPAPKSFGIAGYTPITLKVPRGNVHVVIELKGFRPQEQDVAVTKNNQTVLATLERAPEPARLEIVAANDGGATGADVSIDGVPRGTVPNSFEVVAGRHNIEVKKVGWKPLAKWVDLAEDERRTVEVVLERAEAPTGTLLVTADVPGEVFVDGARKDTAPAVIPGLPPGEHVVEVRREGASPWRQTVVIVAGQQAKVNAVLAGAAAGGGLRVVSSEPNVLVFVDGEEKGRAPVSVPDIKPGQHLIEGRKPQFKPFEQTIEIVPGKQALVQLKMEMGSESYGKAVLKVQSTVPDAEVFLDGSTMGKAPIDRHDLEAGKHYLIVRKDGYEEFKREVYLIEGQPVALVAELRAVGRLRMLSNPIGADVTIDGEPVGRTPVDRPDVAAGDHVFTFRLKGFYDFKQTITVVGGKERLITTDLKPLPSGPSPEQVAKRKAGMSSFGARALPSGGFTADLGVGYPNILMARLTVGAFSLKTGGLDLGVEILTYFQMSTLSLHSRLQLAAAGPLSVAVRGNVGGGAGTNGRNTIFFDVAGIASLDFADVVTFSGDLRFAYWSDQFCPSKTQMDNGVGAEDYCTSPDFTAYPEFGGQSPLGRRFGGSRLYAGLSAVAAYDQQISFFARLDFLPLAGIAVFPAARLAYLDRFNSIMFEHDPLYYGTVGVSLKF